MLTYEELKLFCTFEGGLSEPLQKDGYVYATDSHIIAKQKLTDDLKHLKESTINFDGIFDGNRNKVEINLKDLFKNLSSDNDIKKEYENKKLVCTCIKCPACDDFGYIDVEFDFYNPKTKETEWKTVSVDCPICDEINEDCHVHGNGNVEKYDTTEFIINGVIFREKHIKKIASIFGSKLEYFEGETKQNSTHMIKSKDVEIILMPLRR